MKLLKHIITQAVAKNDEARINQNFPINSQYSVICLAAATLHVRIEDDYYNNSLYANYTKNRRLGNHTNIKRFMNALKRQHIKDQTLIHQFLEKYKDIDLQDSLKAEAWTIHSFGVLSYEDD